MGFNLSDFTPEQIEDAITNTVIDFSSIESIDMSRLNRQIDVTRKILLSFHSGKKIAIIDAPTGFGKSILGFFIHFVMRKLDKTSSKNIFDDTSGFSSYILTSNKFLQEQYLRDIELFEFNDIKMLQGKSNYACNVDPSINFPKAPCAKESVSKLSKDGLNGKYPCFSTCNYLSARRNAMSAGSTVFNYAYFLSTMNYVTKRAGLLAPFPQRPLTIFDECHVVGSVVSDAFSLTINPAKFIREIRAASSVIATQKNDKKLFEYYKDFNAFKNINDIIHHISFSDENLKEKLELLKSEFLLMVNDFAPYISSAVLAKEQSENELSQFDQYILEFSDTILQPYSQLTQQLDVYDKIGFNTAVVSTRKLDPMKNKYLSSEDSQFKVSIDQEVIFECTNESEMVKNYALSFTDYSIFMSATIGKPQDFAKRLELEADTFDCFEVESDFDFSISPIFKVQPMISMSFKDKNANMGLMMKRIIEVIDKNPGVRGLIHTGNFENMKKLQELRHPRILTYSNSTEKTVIIKLLESRPDAIIAGPSLIEGIDLKGDLCRFMIYMKVPYLSLASKLNKRKMELYDDWYNFQTLISFQQGLGRAIRSKTDWCKTYLLDKSFESFFGRYKLPKIIGDRLLETDISDLDQPLASKDDEFEEMLKRLSQK